MGNAPAPTLMGLSLAAGLAREAVDAVPIVKQALGIVVKILALAEKIDKDREALHALAHKSVQLAQRVREVLGDEEPDAKLLPSLERMYRVFQDIETFMAKHVARNRVSRGLSYAFTVNHHVCRLSRSMEDALQEIFAVALLAANSQARAAERDAQYDGEFRLIRHCQVDKLELFREDWVPGDRGSLLIRYHSARVDGQVLVVRYCEETGDQDLHAVRTAEGTAYARLIGRDSILHELSTVQHSHPHVARIYGWGKGSMHNRFTVFKSGFQPVNILAYSLPNPIITLAHCAPKVLAAAHHLRMRGISWHPEGSLYALDDRLEPTIGLQNDLRRIQPGSTLQANTCNHVYWSTAPILAHVPLEFVEAADAQAAIADFHNEQLNNLLSKCEIVSRYRCTIPKAEITNGKLLNDETAEDLLGVAEEEISTCGCHVDSWTWANILLMMDQKRIHQVKNGFHVVYLAQSWSDSIQIKALDEDTERIVYDYYFIGIPDAERDEVREMLGIPSLSEDGITRHLIAAGGPGIYHAFE